jgi:hypothetical protein
MAHVFDQVGHVINVTSPQTVLDMQALINDIRTEEASERGITYDVIATASGKDSLGGSIYTGITVSLNDPWAVAFYVGTYDADIGGGNLVSKRVDQDPIAHVTGGPQVRITRSAASTIAATGSGVTPTDKTDIATAVLAAATANPIASNVEMINNLPITGGGIAGTDEWRPA